MNKKERTIMLNDSQEIDCTEQIKKNSLCCPGILSDCIMRPCPCDCHHRTDRLNHNISFCDMSYPNPLELKPKKRCTQNNNFHIRNKSMINLLNKENRDFIDELRNKYENKNNNRYKNMYYYNYNNYLCKSNVEQDVDSFYINNDTMKKNSVLFNSYSNLDINNNNENDQIDLNSNDKKVIKPHHSFNLNRKETSKYYHTISPKKYSYGRGKLQTVVNANNHRYKEVFCTSKSKKKKKDKNHVNNNNFNDTNNEGCICITRTNDDNNTIKIEINDDNTLKNNNIIKPEYLNYRYESSQNSPDGISTNLYMGSKEPQTEVNSKIVKETFNTRFVDLKNIKNNNNNAYTQKNLYDPDGEINTSYINNNNYDLNTISYDIGTQSPNSFILKQRQNKKDKTNHLNNKSSSKELINSNKKYNNNDKDDIYTCSKKHIPKSYSLKNINTKLPATYEMNTNTIENDYNFKYLNNYNNNKSNNYNSNINNYKVDYEYLKQSVKLALLRKQMHEQRKQKKNAEQNLIDLNYMKSKKYLERFLNKREYNPNNIEDNLYDRTKKIIEQKKLRNSKKGLNFKLKNNFRDKVNHNKHVIKSKIKAWKP